MTRHHLIGVFFISYSFHHSDRVVLVMNQQIDLILHLLSILILSKNIQANKAQFIQSTQG